jgi:hypothetical protein
LFLWAVAALLIGLAIWLTGLVASPRVIAAGLVIELGNGSRESRATDPVSLPISPQVHITSRSGEPLLGFHTRGGGSHKGSILIHRHEWWNPMTLPHECVLHIRQGGGGLRSARASSMSLDRGT